MPKFSRCKSPKKEEISDYAFQSWNSLLFMPAVNVQWKSGLRSSGSCACDFRVDVGGKVLTNHLKEIISYRLALLLVFPIIIFILYL